MSVPLITIGMVVYNGEEYLAEAIQSFLDQACTNFELVIYDNASSDRTPQIAAVFADLDARIRIVRRAENIGAVANFIQAAEVARAEYFCWAAHDDRRDPRFLEMLLHALQANPEADLAACGCLEIDAAGTPQATCATTEKMVTTTGMTDRERLQKYLRHSPCSLIYGLYRTSALKGELRWLNIERNGIAKPLFGGDLIFLAGFLASHDLVFHKEPLLRLRSGGESHRPEAFRNLGHLIGEIAAFHYHLKRATRQDCWRDRMKIAAARWRLLARYLTWPPVLRLFEYQLLRLLPRRESVRSGLAMVRPVFRRLRKRARGLRPGTRVGIYGSGKHTRRYLDVIRMAIGKGATIVAVGDDRPERALKFDGVPTLGPHEFSALDLDVIVVSSDTYERTLYARARHIARPGTQVWCIYDLTIESSRRALDDRVAAFSTECRNTAMASIAS